MLFPCSRHKCRDPQNNNLENVPTAIGPSEKSTVTFYIDTLNGKNYIQFFENDIDRGYLFFDESRNLKS